MQEQFEEECNNAVKAIFDARASNDYGCCSIKYLLNLIKISINKYKNLVLTVKLCTAISEYMPEYKIRRYTINLCSSENLDIEVSSEDEDSEKEVCSEDEDNEKEVCSEKEDIILKSKYQKDLQNAHSIKKINPCLKKCQEVILKYDIARTYNDIFNYDSDKTHNDIFKRINYLIELIEKCIDNYEDPDVILQLCTFLKEYSEHKMNLSGRSLRRKKQKH